MYKPLFKGLRKSSKMSLMFNFFLMVRRITLLYFAMFMPHHPVVQVIIFICFSLASLCYLARFKPLKSKVQMLLQVFNEASTLIVSYLVLQINDVEADGKEFQTLGQLISYTLYITWSFNIGIILLSLARQIYKKVKKWCYRRKNKKIMLKQNEKLIRQKKEKNQKDMEAEMQ